ncbi:cupin domain-containing protein [Oceanithermus profundus]|uniref:Cupin 2 conserved barrel domain protein n=1 Tax=Oceanithermus profundus (strain DSM 14977 / NBRC 100410 / VKM B-2274 / 506) TaxID=670487 RepID=E4U7A2_OCEP5|nr:cupin domain-containing protein [Oceanithermus profundus]ADR36231.1 Cupin 2 conserved barrel domain protein [Oceanithermus profundus DSM 14977]
MEIIDASEATGAPARKVYDHPQGQALMVVLKPGETLRRHTAPVDIFIYVLEGEGVVHVGEASARVRPDLLVPCAAGVPHALENTGEAVLRALVVKLGAG